MTRGAPRRVAPMLRSPASSIQRSPFEPFEDLVDGALGETEEPEPRVDALLQVVAVAGALNQEPEHDVSGRQPAHLPLLHSPVGRTYPISVQPWD